MLVSLSHTHTQFLNLNARLALTLLSHTFADTAILNYAGFFPQTKNQCATNLHFDYCKMKNVVLQSRRNEACTRDRNPNT